MSSPERYTPRDVLVACRRVIGEPRARQPAVRLNDAAIRRVANQLSETAPVEPVLHPAHQEVGRGLRTWTFVVVLDAVNFGSGWFDEMDPVAGGRGYEAVAMSGSIRPTPEKRQTDRLRFHCSSVRNCWRAISSPRRLVTGGRRTSTS